MKVENKNIGKEHPTYFIADIAANHDGDLERAKNLIYLAAESGADAAKFQHFTAKTIVSDSGFKDLGGIKSHQSSWGDTVFRVYERATVNLDWTEELAATCRLAGISFMTSPYSLELVDYIDQYIPAYKIGSGDITWIGIIERIASKKKPYFLASGASTLNDVQIAVEAALKINSDLCLMQCNTNYTADVENFKYINLNVLKTYRKLYPDLVLGLSDHTPGHATVLGAITLGARVIEKHFTDDTRRAGPDHAFSMSPHSWSEMVNRARELECALGNGLKVIEENERETVVLQRRAIRVKKDIFVGHILSSRDVEYLRPCPVDAISPAQFPLIDGRQICRDLKIGDYVKWSDIS